MKVETRIVCTKPFIPGICHTCGSPIEGKRRIWYCSKECKKTYWINHYWREARAECLKRANHICVQCEGQATQAHHIVPLEGTLRHDNCLNHQENLMALCNDCHAETRRTKPQKMLIIRAGAPLFDLEPYTIGAT